MRRNNNAQQEFAGVDKTFNGREINWTVEIRGDLNWIYFWVVVGNFGSVNAIWGKLYWEAICNVLQLAVVC